MRKFLDSIFKNQSLIYKYFLYVACVSSIVFFFPRGGQFKYEFQKGKPWQYENLYAPFDFSIRKTSDEISKEKAELSRSKIDYYVFDDKIVSKVYSQYEEKFPAVFSSDTYSPAQLVTLSTTGKEILDSVYLYGILKGSSGNNMLETIYLVKNNEASRTTFGKLNLQNDLGKIINGILRKKGLRSFSKTYQELFNGLLLPNVNLDKKLSNRAFQEKLLKVSNTRGTVDEGKLIVAKGEVVESENYKVLDSLKQEYESELWAANNYYYILFGYTVLVALVIMMLFLFIKKYRPLVYENNVKVTFIVFNILLMVFITTLVVKYDETYIFVVPLCILPLILKTFFDARLGLFVHVLTVLILGFVVPNSFEYIFLQITAGIVTILTVSELYKRANLFISVGQITLILCNWLSGFSHYSRRKFGQHHLGNLGPVPY